MGLFVFPFCALEQGGQNCDFFAYFAKVRTCKTKKLGPTKLCFILHGIGSTATTDQGECGFLIVGLFVFPLCALKQEAKSVIFCKGPDL